MSIFITITISDITFYSISIIHLFVSQAKGFVFFPILILVPLWEMLMPQKGLDAVLNPGTEKYMYFAMIKQVLIHFIHQCTYISVWEWW